MTILARAWSPTITEVWREGDTKVCLLDPATWQEIAPTRDETAAWRLVKSHALTTRHRSAKDKEVTRCP